MRYAALNKDPGGIMMKFFLVTVLLLPAISFADQPTEKERIKHWYMGLGPAFSTALSPGINPPAGTKYNFDVAYNQGLSERISLLYFYDGSFNTATQGTTGISEFGVGVHFFTTDRGTDTSLFLDLDLGYGGGNRYIDSSACGGIGLGVEFFRTRDFVFEVMVRRVVVGTTATTSLPSYPTVDQLRFGVYF